MFVWVYLQILKIWNWNTIKHRSTDKSVVMAAAPTVPGGFQEKVDVTQVDIA